MSSETTPGVDPQLVAFVQRKLALENQMKAGINWFYWITGLSLINSLAYRSGLSWSFVVGLGMTQFVDGVATTMSEALGSGSNTVHWISFGVNLLIAGMFVLFGVLGRKRYRLAVIGGMALYALDAAIFLLVQGYLAIAFHGLALYGLWRGLKATNELITLEQNPPAGDPATVEQMLQAAVQEQRVPGMVRINFSPWFFLTILSGLATTFFIVLYIVMPITVADLVTVQGILEQYTTTSEENLRLRLRGDPRTFKIEDLEFFDRARFAREVTQGDSVSLAILKRMQDNTSQPLIVFELGAGDIVYLPREPCLAVRERDRNTIGIAGGISLAICAATGALGYRHERRKRARTPA